MDQHRLAFSVTPEPQLKYARLGSSFLTIIRDDRVSAFCATTKFLVFFVLMILDPCKVVGMASGHLHILDVTGNEVRKYRQHRSPILCVSADEAGEHVASGGQDGIINRMILWFIVDWTNRSHLHLQFVLE